MLGTFSDYNMLKYSNLHRIIPHSRSASIRALNPALAAAMGDKFVAPQIWLRSICGKIVMKKKINHKI